MKGLLIYNKEDFDRNNSYVQWLQEEGKKKGLDLELAFGDEILTKGIKEKKRVDFVINRTRSYEICILFELNNIRVFNNSTVTLIGNNKLAAYKYAEEKGYSYPKVVLSWENRGNIISKPINGHGGEGIGLVSDIDVRDGWIRLQQEFVTNLVGDIRFYIIDNKIIHGVLRTSSDKIISNFSQGGDIRLYDFSQSEKEYVEGFIKDIDVDYAGIDFLLTKDGKLIFNEIEDVVGSRMLSKLGINDTTELYLNHIVKQLQY